MAAILLPVISMGKFSGFTLWNMSPPLVSLLLLLLWKPADHPPRQCPLWLCAGTFAASALTLAFHLAWYFDIGGTATSSSTSALAFIFVPLWAFLISAALALAVALFSALMHRQPDGK